MTDDELIAHLQELEAKGASGIAEMREVMKTCGGMKRLLAIAARGLGGKPKSAGRVNPAGKSRIPDDWPDADAKAKAIAYWTGKGRPDLVARIEEEAEKFHAHHLAAGTRSESWPASFKTWYSNAIEFVRPPRGADLFVASENPIAKQRVNIAEWVSRLETFYGDTSMNVGTWPPMWGGKPPVEPTDPIPANCACPTQAFSLYLERKNRRTGS